MSSSSSHTHRSSSRSSGSRGDPASFITTVLLGLILLTGPLILGAARLWLQLPLLGAVALLLLLQGLRLTGAPIGGALRKIDAIDITVILFVIYTVIRWLTSPTEYFSRIEAMDVLAYAVVFLTCRYGIAPRAYGIAIIYGLVALGVFEVGFGYYLNHHCDWLPFGPNEQLHLWYFPRWVGTYGCPNHYGSLLVMAAGAALAVGSFSRLSWPLRIVFFYLAGVMIVGVMYSLSRGSYLALVGSIIALTTFGVRNGTVRWWIPVIATVLLLLGGATLFSISPEVRDRYNDARETVVTGQLNGYVRLELARDALHIAADHTLFGTGPGTFVYIHPRYQDSTFDRKAVLAHDDYLNCLDDYGLVGFSLAMLFLWLVTLTYFRPLWADNRWQDRVVIAAGFAAWGALLVHSFLDFNLHIPANALLFFSLVGLGLGRLRRDESVRHWSLIPLALLGGLLGWLLVLLSLLFGAQATRSALSDIAYEQAFDAALSVPISQSVRDTESSLALDPANAQALLFLGDLHRYQASRRDAIEDRISEGQLAMAAYQRAFKANPLDDTIRARMGMTFDIMRRYPEAYFCYRDAVTQQPYNGQFWYWLGNHYWQRGMLDKAEQAYVRAQHCPFGKEGTAEAIQELRALPGRQDLPVPPSDINPLEAAPPMPIPATPPEERPPTVP